jgi:hypothetical protein
MLEIERREPGQSKRIQRGRSYNVEYVFLQAPTSQSGALKILTECKLLKLMRIAFEI